MYTRLSFFLLILVISNSALQAQTGTISGTVLTDEIPTEYVTLSISGTSLGTITNTKGTYRIPNVPFGEYEITASYVGYKPVTKHFHLTEHKPINNVLFSLTEKTLDLDAVVVTGTKTFKRKTNSPIIVNVLNSQTLDNVQACNLSEGLKFQPGLRVETNCQTCNYTQLRMNGLTGGYSQILINGRPIFSPLTGLYGLEQIPVNMIERIEVIRGGGSSLYGSSAVGGTVNVITKIPRKNSYQLSHTYQNINGQTNDNQTMGNATIISKDRTSGISFFLNKRERGLYDHNGDNFSEIPMLENTSIGANFFFLPKENQKLEFSISNLNEFRYGGEMVDKPSYLALQSEERTHNVWMGSADYQINFKNNNTTFISYLAWQQTLRKHYTGIVPDSGTELQNHLENPPYGNSKVQTLNGGIQINHKLHNFIKGTNTLTFGLEYVIDDVFDVIPAYNFKVDQTTKDLGTFIQSDWAIVPQITLLTGVRMDKHNLVNPLVFSPRTSLLYKLRDFTQIRINYGAGFRAPQAFDSDLHIAFAGGGVSRISLSPDLTPEKSQSLSTSINFDRPGEHFIAGFTLEGFYTRLNEAFYLEPVGQDGFGQLFQKRNGQGATVQGVTLEARANYDRKIQLESGFTLQTSEFDETVSYIDGLEGIQQFVRTPNQYGFATLSITPNPKISANLNYVYTGTMKVPHFAGAPNQTIDEIINSNPFSELSAKFAYTIALQEVSSNIELYAGVKNILNAYQNQFDVGKNRDSNFVYGPSQPRTIYFGIKLKSK
ncbi:MAG: TonB-dependent receptor [Bacteroidetes bacterium]|nr:MAG: TonB-dependent receptor [Bacteroidota bacterium]